MKPEPMTDEQINQITCVNFEEPAQVRAIIAARDEQWQEIVDALEKQEPVAWRVWNGGLQDDGNVYLYSEQEDGAPLYLAAGAQQQDSEEVENLKFKADYWRRMHDELSAESVKKPQQKTGSYALTSVWRLTHTEGQ